MRTRHLILSALALVLIAATGCSTSNRVPLTYQPVAVDVDRCPYKIAVVKFADKRDTEAIGEKEGETIYYPASDVSTWVSRALAEQLASNGCDASYSELESDFAVDGVIVGEVQKAYFKQTSFKDYNTSLIVKAMLKKEGRTVYIKTYQSSSQNVALPTGDNREIFLRENLQEIMRAMVPDMVKNVQ